jgi:predicted nucleotidyltransferase/predicted transcriptional regulator with HTH domain
MINLRSKLRESLLAYYFLNPHADHYVRELARMLQVDPANLSKELTKLEREGLFSSKLRGNQKYFFLNRGYSLINEVRHIVLNTKGIVPTLRQAISGIAGIKDAYLYGSFAKGEQDAQSDIDVLVVGRPKPYDLESVVRKLERQFGREVNYTVLSEAEFKKKLAQKDPFLEDIWHGKKIRLSAA